MKCLHCGNESDRFSKWKGASEFCSEECRKASQEESDKLAVRRLMQPRRVTTVQRAAPSTVSRNEGAVAVAEPAKPQGPEAPPEAKFFLGKRTHACGVAFTVSSLYCPSPAGFVHATDARRVLR